MAALQDLTGQTFGRLTVLHRVENYVTKHSRSRPAWLCQCECGNQITVRDDRLKSGNTRSCGCLHKDVMKNLREDLTGQVFGQLTVMGPAEDYVDSKGKHQPRWHCQCECGKQTVVLSSSLKSGATRSCGGTHARRLKNEYDLTGDYGIGYTRNGEPFWFDKEDFDKIKDYTWGYNSKGYVRTKINISYCKLGTIYLHNLVMNPPPGMIVDHKTHPKDPRAHKADNRKCNLRLATPSQNNQNCNRPKSPTTDLAGIRLEGKKYLANITKDGKRHRKSFPCTPEGLAAAIAWRKDMEEKLFGEFRYSAHNPEQDTGPKP